MFFIFATSKSNRTCSNANILRWNLNLKVIEICNFYFHGFFLWKLMVLNVLYYSQISFEINYIYSYLRGYFLNYTIYMYIGWLLFKLHNIYIEYIDKGFENPYIKVTGCLSV